MSHALVLAVSIEIGIGGLLLLCGAVLVLVAAGGAIVIWRRSRPPR
jgi:hypothetical protein